PEILLARGIARRALDAEESRQDPLHVSVHERDRAPEGDRGDGAHRVAAEPGKVSQRLDVVRELSAEPVDDRLRGAVAVPRARVVPEASPGGEHLVEAGPGERGDVGEAREERRPVGQHHRHLRLLEHHLAHPDGVGVAGAAPGEVTGLRVVPAEQRGTEIAGRSDASSRAPLTSLPSPADRGPGYSPLHTGMGQNVLSNDFSWSKSRHEKFQDCRRAYYLHYYGSWGGWEDGAHPELRQLWVLKKLANRFHWAGSVVHAVIKDALLEVRAGRRPDGTKAITRARFIMREDYKHS